MKNKLLLITFILPSLFSCTGNTYGEEISKEQFFYSAALVNQGYLNKVNTENFVIKKVTASIVISQRGSTNTYKLDKDCGYSSLEEWSNLLVGEEKYVAMCLGSYTYTNIVNTLEQLEGTINFYVKNNSLLTVRANQYTREGSTIDGYIDSTYQWDEYGHIYSVYVRSTADINNEENNTTLTVTGTTTITSKYEYGYTN